MKRFEPNLVQLLAHPGDFVDEFLVRITVRVDFRNCRGQIAFVHHRAVQSGDPFADAGDAERRRSHIDAAAVAAEIKRNTNDMNGRGHAGTIAKRASGSRLQALARSPESGVRSLEPMAVPHIKTPPPGPRARL